MSAIRRAFAYLVPVFVTVTGLAADAAPPEGARAYQCGDGTPDPHARKCDCKAGRTATLTTSGVARCTAPLTAPPATCPSGMVGVGGGGYAPAARTDEVVVAPFCLDRTEVTVAAFDRCVAAGACTAASPYDTKTKWKWQALCNEKHPDKRDTHPINCVKPSQADAYCAFAKGRLPSEVEWEWAARGGAAGTDYPWGSAPPSTENVNACGSECPPNAKAKVGDTAGVIPVLFGGTDGFPETAPVGSFPRGDGPLGIHDLAGNVAEWTTGTLETRPGVFDRIARGGSWRTSDGALLAMARVPFAESQAFPAVGFRCAGDPAKGP